MKDTTEKKIKPNSENLSNIVKEDIIKEMETENDFPDESQSSIYSHATVII